MKVIETRHGFEGQQRIFTVYNKYDTCLRHKLFASESLADCMAYIWLKDNHHRIKLHNE